MANLKGVNINKGTTGGSVLAGGDGISGLVVTVPPGINEIASLLNKVKSATSIDAIEKGYGITEDLDMGHGIALHRHFSEFFRNADDGAELHFALVETAQKMKDICLTVAKNLLVEAEGKVRQLAIAVNPEYESIEDIIKLDSIPLEVHQAILYAQGLAEWAADNKMPCQVFLEGYGFDGDASGALNLRAIENVAAPKVSVFIGQDYGYARKISFDRKSYYADVGTLLGVASKAKVNQNVGNNELFNISGKGSWLEPGLSSGERNKDVYYNLQTLENKGYLFGLNYVGLSGVRINNDHTCVEVIIDTEGNMNEHTIAYGRTLDKAVRLLNSVYLPKVKSDWLLDRKTGKLAPATIAALEDIGDTIFEGMLARQEITYGKTKVDENSDLVGEKILKISFGLIPRGTINEIQGTINLKVK